MCDLPLELVTGILLLLPAKPLTRFQCVSKLFLTTISSPDFTTLHLTTTSPRLHLILYSDDWPSRIYSSSFSTSLRHVVRLNNPLRSPRHPTVILGSSNGLLLFHNTDDDLAVSNPFTKRYVKLPFFPCENKLDDQFSYFGFGYDFASDDYKVVRIATFNSIKRVSVYSLRLNLWIKVRDFDFEGYEFYGTVKCGALADDGCLYWLCYKGFEMRVVGFDLRTDSFFEILMPDCKDDELVVMLNDEDEKEDVGLSLEVLGGELCVNLFARHVGFVVFVWKKEKGGDGNGVWKWLCKGRFSDFGDLSDNICRSRPLAYSMDGGGVLIDADGMGIARYDLQLKTIEMTEFPALALYEAEQKRIDMIDIVGIRLKFNAVVCWESLVPVGSNGRFDGEIEEQQMERIIPDGFKGCRFVF